MPEPVVYIYIFFHNLLLPLSSILSQVQNLTQKTQDCAKKAGDIRAPLPCPVKAKRQDKRARAAQSNLQLLRETQQFNSRLKQNDLSWET